MSFFVASSSAALSHPSVPHVRVLVEKEKSILYIEGLDLVITETSSGKVLQKSHGRARIPIPCQQRNALSIQSRGGFLKVDGRQYRNRIDVYFQWGQCLAVNQVDLEKYVAGLLNSEMSSSWNLETLKAQAVAARTYAIYQMQQGANPLAKAAGFDLDSSVKDQVYEGAHKERFKAILAVSQTHGQILSYVGKPIKAFYHSTCGGHTETPEKVWGLKLPYFRSVNCGYCDSSPRFSWSFSQHLNTLGQKLQERGIIKSSLQALRVAKRNLVGRASEIELIENVSLFGGGPSQSLGLLASGSDVIAGRAVAFHVGKVDGKMKRISAATLRDTLGTDLLKSTDFHVAQAGDWLAFAGHGSGHGVGLCQWGAKVMGEKGFRYKDILSKYYPLAQITKIY